MDYHKDRFEDFSLMVFKNEKLVALLPANRVGNEIHSHQGLTYGGLIFSKKDKFGEVSEIFNSIIVYLKENNIIDIQIKIIPEFYCKQASNEIAYLLFAKNAELYRREMVLAIDFSKQINIHKTKLKNFKKSDKLGFQIISTDDFSNFWKKILEPRLEQKYQTKPVHSLEEILFLKSKFPNNIQQFDISYEDEIVAGITIFKTNEVVKSQYGATSLKGEKLRALEYLFIHLIEKFRLEGKQYFSMGTIYDSNELGYNRGLLKQKEELGCSVHLQDFYKLKL